MPTSVSATPSHKRLSGWWTQTLRPTSPCHATMSISRWATQAVVVIVRLMPMRWATRRHQAARRGALAGCIQPATFASVNGASTTQNGSHQLSEIRSPQRKIRTSVGSCAAPGGGRIVLSGGFPTPWTRSSSGVTVEPFWRPLLGGSLGLIGFPPVVARYPTRSLAVGR